MRKTYLYILFALCCFPLAAQSEQDVTDRFLAASAAYAEGQLAQARAQFRQLHAEVPDDDAISYYLGMSELSLGNLDAAEEHILQAVRADSTNIWYVYAAASLYDAKRDQIKAGDYVEKLVKMNPSLYSNPNTLSMVADAKAASGRDSLALVYYGQALAMDPAYAPALFGRMEVHRQQGNFPAYFVALEELVRGDGVGAEFKTRYLTALMDSIDSPFYWVWGDTLNRLVDLLRDKYPDDYDAQLLKLRMCYIKQDWEAVLAQCDVMAELARAQGDNDRLAEALSIAGDVWYQQFGNRKKAYATYEQALLADPDRTSVLNNYAYYLSLERRKLRKALKMSRRSVELEPDNATYLDTLGWLLYLLKKPEEAKPYFKHAMIYGGKDSAVVLEHYARVLEALGEDDLALYYQNLSDQKNK